MIHQRQSSLVSLGVGDCSITTADTFFFSSFSCLVKCSIKMHEHFIICVFSAIFQSYLNYYLWFLDIRGGLVSHRTTLVPLSTRITWSPK